MRINEETFCAAPWFQIRLDNTANYRPCCCFRPHDSRAEGSGQKWPEVSIQEWLDSDYVSNVRQNLMQGNKIPECNECWRNESIGIKSLRQVINDTVTNGRGQDLNQTWLHSYFKNKTDFNQDLLLGIDLQVNNLCNFSCIMCHPLDSTKILTKWRQSADHPVIRQRVSDDPHIITESINLAVNADRYLLLQKAIDLSPRYLKILGGEPLIDSKLMNILTNTDPEKKSKTTLMFVTNGSVDLVDIAQQLCGWRGVFFSVSLEGVGSVQEYIRQGSDWNQIKNNINRYVTLCKTPLSISVCLQSLSLYHLPDLLSWAQDLSIEVQPLQLENPNYLSLAAIPTGLRDTIAHNFSQKKTHLNASYSNILDWCLDMLDFYPWQPTLTEQKNHYLDWYDAAQTWQIIMPEWLPYLRDCKISSDSPYD